MLRVFLVTTFAFWGLTAFAGQETPAQKNNTNNFFSYYSVPKNQKTLLNHVKNQNDKAYFQQLFLKIGQLGPNTNVRRFQGTLFVEDPAIKGKVAIQMLKFPFSYWINGQIINVEDAQETAGVVENVDKLMATLEKMKKQKSASLIDIFVSEAVASETRGTLHAAVALNAADIKLPEKLRFSGYDGVYDASWGNIMNYTGGLTEVQCMADGSVLGKTRKGVNFSKAASADSVKFFGQNFQGEVQLEFTKVGPILDWAKAAYTGQKPSRIIDMEDFDYQYAGPIPRGEACLRSEGKKGKCQKMEKFDSVSDMAWLESYLKEADPELADQLSQLKTKSQMPFSDELNACIKEHGESSGKCSYMIKRHKIDHGTDATVLASARHYSELTSRSLRFTAYHLAAMSQCCGDKTCRTNAWDTVGINVIPADAKKPGTK